MGFISRGNQVCLLQRSRFSAITKLEESSTRRSAISYLRWGSLEAATISGFLRCGDRRCNDQCASLVRRHEHWVQTSKHS